MESLHLVVTTLGALAGIIIGIVKKGYRRVGYGITAGALLVGLPVSLMSSEAKSEGLTTLSDLETKAKAGLKKVGIDIESGGIIDTD